MRRLASLLKLSCLASTANGVVERHEIVRLIEVSRTMLFFAKAPLFLWAEAVATACSTQNRSMIRRRHGKTPYELLHDKPPDLSYLHVFGALCYPTNNTQKVIALEVVAPENDVSTGSPYSQTIVDQDATITKTTKDALTQACWDCKLFLRKRKLHEFERLDVWELVPPPDKALVHHSLSRSISYVDASRPDLQFAICMCARYQARPTEKHLNAVKRIFQYLKGTVHRGLWYLKDSSIALTALQDAGSCMVIQDTRRSTSGSIQLLGDRLVSWSSKRQKSVV
ncbi:retrovirus-related pol polyprotein from transposon TNT 1-94 [Tanacetum coccineum]